MREVDDYKSTLRRNLQLAQELLEKRIDELEQQRSCLTRDLEAKVLQVVELERQLSTAHARTGDTAADDKLERERAHHRSVEQRLAQLVAVHRQLLRKYGSLEIENGECRKKIQLRDERIQQLDQQVGRLSECRGCRVLASMLNPLLHFFPFFCFVLFCLSCCYCADPIHERKHAYAG